MKYGYRVNQVEGIIVEVKSGSVAVDLKGRLGYIKVPKRMVISDHPIEVGQEVRLMMSYIEVMGPEINEKYKGILERKKKQEKEDE